MFYLLAFSAVSFSQTVEHLNKYLYGLNFPNPNVGYAVGSYGTILKITNGNTVTKLNSGTKATLFAVSFADANVGYAAGDSGIITKTVDGGSNWAEIPRVASSVSYVNFITADSGYAIWGGAIYKTSNGGTTWGQWTTLPSTVSTFGFYNSQIAYAAGSNIYKTTNGGASWTTYNGNFSSIRMSSTYIVDTNAVFFSGSGKTIKKLNSTGANTIIGDNIFTGDVYNSIAFTSPSNGIVVGTNGAILKSTNSGATWANVNSKTTNNLSALCFTDANTGYTVGENNTILKTTDGGSTWSSLSKIPDQYLTKMQVIDENTCFALSSVYFLKTFNGGTTWDSIPIPVTTNYYNGIYFTNSTTGYIVGIGGKIQKTTDGGNTWTAQTSGTTEELIDLKFTNANTGYVIGNKGIVLKTTNAGATWTQLTTNNTQDSFFQISFPSANTGYVCGYGSVIIKTTNAGATWSNVNLTSACSISFLSDNVGYAGCIDGKIYKTTNGGSNWVLQYTGIGKIASIYAIDANKVYAVGISGTIKKTINGGATWTSVANPTQSYTSNTPDLYQISFYNQTGYAIGEYSTILKFYDSSITTESEEIENSSSNYIISPNPTSDKLRIENLSNTKETSISIYNISGQLILTKTTNNTEVEIDVNKIDNGIYFVRIQTDDNIESMKFIKE
ncbi:MAG: YCF48-related protein [Bacteroidota bacterium]